MSAAAYDDCVSLDHVMTDHPGWRLHDGLHCRAFALTEDAACVRSSTPFVPLGDDAVTLELDVFVIDQESVVASSVVGSRLSELGRVGRYRNPSLWDAIGTSIIRQVIRAPQARKLYQRFCQVYGAPITDEAGPHWLFPEAETVLTLDVEDFARIGMAFKRKALRAAATAYLEAGAEWQATPPAELVEVLQQVPHIGPWTARATVADFSNDWSLYAYDDLAVRTWARRAIPEVAWAPDERTFGQQWLKASGDQLGSATLLALAWGDFHGDRHTRSERARGS